MHKKVNIQELYKQRDEIYEKYKQDRTLFKEYDKIMKKIRYWTNDDFRLNKNIKDNARYTINKYSLNIKNDIIDVM
jgi:hypothetical protein